MIPYKSSSGKESGVTAYDLSDDRIVVMFRNGATYIYTYESAGKAIIEKMKALAETGEGLSTFISRNQPEYENN